MCDCLHVDIPDTGMCIRPGDKVKIGRFSTTTWLVGYGWYTWGGNRPVCGWFLTNLDKVSEIKPLQQPDLHDIYFIEN